MQKNDIFCCLNQQKMPFLQKNTAHIERYMLNNSYICHVAEKSVINIK